MKKYDVAVIGAGPAGYAAAMRAIDFGKSVALIEKDILGGAGIYKGALWSKTWWELAREAQTLRKHGSTLSFMAPQEFNFKRIQTEVLQNERADYGRQILATLSRQLVAEFGRGFAEKSLRRMVQFV